MESLTKTVNDQKPFTIFVKLSILDVCRVPGYARDVVSGLCTVITATLTGCKYIKWQRFGFAKMSIKNNNRIIKIYEKKTL